MNIGILGYGKMGKIIHTVSETRGHTVSEICDSHNVFAGNAGVFIDFSVSSAVMQNAQLCGEKKIPLVLGTTGWTEHKAELDILAKKFAIPIVYSGNFSLGVNLFWRSLAAVATEFSHFKEEYDVFLHEFHHRQKTDSPSGTALTTAGILQENFVNKKKLCTKTLENRAIEAEELHCTATRGGNIPGTHKVFFDSLFDTIEITHTARNREGFALGAVMMAEKISVLPAGIHHFPDIFGEIFGR